ncbi:alpha/beta hydrolase, partial [Flavobacteriaceae bacterium]|nr:alpha/beta hydrolase [Flavobacteriaceae bacterium]
MKTMIPKIIGAFINFIGIFNTAYASKLALNLFSKPRNGKLTPHINSFLETATSKTILHYNSLPIQTYQWEGTKETVLLAHGWESNSGRWRHKIQK